HYSTALADLPRARALAVCAAGAGSPAGRRRLGRALAPWSRGAQLALLPDYAAVWAAAPAGTAIVAVAGTGSVVASRRGAGYLVTGGAGAPGGDPGSAVRLGRVALERGPAAGDALGPAVAAGHGGPDGAACVAGGAGERTAAEQAAHAPLLTGAAERGEAWAAAALRAELAPLAADVRRHAARLPGRRRGGRPRLALAGGVFDSPAAFAAFEGALGPAFEVVPLGAEPVVGAVRIARGLAA
ncbi:MAG: hypothetical protein GXY03_13650, partial [Solirubrobacterales bacterium]|nr:hypothetical protein [Solirubrobacterales bacterium]